MKGKISLEDLVEQFLDQCRSGNVPDIQDFAGAHPEFASELRSEERRVGKEGT